MNLRDACTEIKAAPFAVLLVVFPAILFRRYNWHFKILHTSECQISTNCSVLPLVSFCDSHLLSDSSVVPHDLHGSQTLLILAILVQYPITDRGHKQRLGEEQKYSKYQERHLKFSLLNSDDQNSIYPSLRLSNEGRSEHPLPTETS